MESTIDIASLWQQWLNTSKQLEQSTPPELTPIVKQVTEVSTLYMRLAKQLSDHSTTDQAVDMQNWLQTLEQTVGKWLQQSINSLHSAAKPESLGLDLARQIELNTQVQQSIQRYQVATTRHQQALHHLQTQILDALKADLLSTATQEKSPHSLRDLLEQWGERYETHYQNWLLSSDYPVLQGELINSGVALQTSLQSSWVPLIQLAALPTQQDMRQVYAQLQQLRRDNQLLRTEIIALKTQLAPASA